MKSRDDHYSVIGLAPDASHADIGAACEQLLKQANALANVDPERSQAIRERVRRIRQDLLTSEESRRAYDSALLGGSGSSGEAGGHDVPLMAQQAERAASSPREPAWRPTREEGTGTRPHRARRRVTRLLLLGLGGVLVIALAAGGGYAFATGGFTGHRLATPTPTITPTATSTPTPVPTPWPTVAPTPLPTGAPTGSTPPTLAETKSVVDAVQTYLAARNTAFGPSHDGSGLPLVTSGEALRAADCILRGQSDSLVATHAYYLYHPTYASDPKVTTNGATATYTQDRDGMTTLHHGNGRNESFRDTYTVTYFLSLTPRGWLVDDYVWNAPDKESGTAASDAAPCA